MAVRNLKYNKDGTIDIEYLHPVYGWIPFTTSSSDSDDGGRVLFSQAVAGTFGEIAPYVKPLEQSQAEQLAAMETSYRAAVSLPISYMATTFQADAESQLLIAAVLTASGGTLPAGFAWFDTNNTPVTMDFAQLQGLAGSILLRGQPLFVTKQTKKAAIRAATTAQQVESIIWN
jgi:lysozyme family protein